MALTRRVSSIVPELLLCSCCCDSCSHCKSSQAQQRVQHPPSGAILWRCWCARSPDVLRTGQGGQPGVSVCHTNRLCCTRHQPDRAGFPAPPQGCATSCMRVRGTPCVSQGPASFLGPGWPTVLACVWQLPTCVIQPAPATNRLTPVCRHQQAHCGMQPCPW